MRECIRGLVLFSCLLDHVLGIAKLSQPVVYSYSSVVSTIHPAIISHHYHQPLTEEPKVVDDRPKAANDGGGLYYETQQGPTGIHVPESRLRLGTDAYYNDGPSQYPLPNSQPPLYEDYDYSTVAPHDEVDYDYDNVTEFTASRFAPDVNPTSNAFPTSDYESSNSGSESENDAPIEYPVSQVTLAPNYDDMSYIDYESHKPINQYQSTEHLPPIADYSPPNAEYITVTGSKYYGMQPNIKEPEVYRKRNSTSRMSDKVLQRPMYFAYSSDLPNVMLKNGAPMVDEQPKKNNEKFVKEGGQDHSSAHKVSKGHKGDEGYETSHQHTSGKKGHHDKEGHKGKYVDEKGKKAKHKEEGGHYDEHHKKEKGQKAAKYDEAGKHKKGHSTKGEHNVHKKDEYVKKYEFYDEHHEGGGHEKRGGFAASHKKKKGGKKKKGHHKSGLQGSKKGKKGGYEKGSKSNHHIGHKDGKGYDGHFEHHKKYEKKGRKKKGKKWGYNSGHPD